MSITAQLPYSHLENSTPIKLDGLGLAALRAMVDVEPYGSSGLDADPLEEDPPSLSSVSPSEDDDPEDPENASGKKKNKKTKGSRQERRRSKESKAISTSKIVVNLQEFTKFVDTNVVPSRRSVKWYQGTSGGGVQIAGAEDEEDSEKQERNREQKKKRGGKTRHPETKAGQKPPSRLRCLVSFRDGFLG